MFELLGVVRGMVLRIALVFFILFILLTAVPWSEGDRVPLYPSRGGETVPTYLIETLKRDALPEGIPLIVRHPMDPFIVHISLGAGMAGVFTLIYALFELYRFARPGLFPFERRLLALALLFAMSLAVLGGWFAYVFLVPTTMSALALFLPAGVDPLFDLRDVFLFIEGIVLGTALLFLIPIVMTMLSAGGLVPALVWRRYYRHALMGAIILSAVVTPDGSGVTMALLAGPLFLLYLAGATVSAFLSRPAPPTSSASV